MRREAILKNMEFNLKNTGSFLVCWVIGSLLPSLAGAEAAVAATISHSSGTPAESAAAATLIPDAIWLIGLALIALVAITRRRLK